jgi:hypothetical protein
MHFLREKFEEIEGLESFIDSVSANPLTQGVVFDLNPLWFDAYRISQAGLEPKNVYGLDIQPFEIATQLIQGSDSFIDLAWTDPFVDGVCQNLFGQNFGKNIPFLVKVVAFPVIYPERAEARSALVRAARSAPFPAIIETRPPASLVVSSGDLCVTTSGRRGTVGGFLKDTKTSNVYAATCGHVVGSGPVTVKGQPIGNCKHAWAPTRLTTGQVCLRTGPGVNRLDLALIDVTGTSVTNSMSAVAQRVYPKEIIDVAGAETGAASYEVGGACSIYQIGGICFDNLFEVRPPSPRGILSPRVGAFIAKVPQPGDSGAWVRRAGAPDWCGIVVASDHLMGYALEADTVISQANNVFDMNLCLA